MSISPLTGQHVTPVQYCRDLSVSINPRQVALHNVRRSRTWQMLTDDERALARHEDGDRRG